MLATEGIIIHGKKSTILMIKNQCGNGMSILLAQVFHFSKCPANSSNL
jgi:hypothetical protein